MTIGNVRARAMPRNAQAARNLPRTACVIVMGSVNSSSIEPTFRSSAHSRIAVAGHHEDEQQRQIDEERLQVRLPGLEEALLLNVR